MTDLLLVLEDALPPALRYAVRDPTGTASIRRSFRAESERRLNAIRSLAFQLLVEQDYLRQRDPLQALERQDPDPHARLEQFLHWFGHVAGRQLSSTWSSRHMTAAWRSGLRSGHAILGTDVPPPPGPLPELRVNQAQRELAGIAGVINQGVARVLTQARLLQTKPQLAYRSVLAVLRKVGRNRLNAHANVTTVALHNAGRLAAFRVGGIRQVGVVAERLPRPISAPLDLRRPLRTDAIVIDITREEAAAQKREQQSREAEKERAAFTREEEGDTLVNIQTAGDDVVCEECLDISDNGPYALDEAETLIPAHPNCRCAFVPAHDMRYSVNREIAEQLSEED